MTTNRKNVSKQIVIKKILFHSNYECFFLHNFSVLFIEFCFANISKIAGQNCRKFDLNSRKLCPPNILSAEIFDLRHGMYQSFIRRLAVIHFFLKSCSLQNMSARLKTEINHVVFYFQNDDVMYYLRWRRSSARRDFSSCFR